MMSKVFAGVIATLTGAGLAAAFTLAVAHAEGAQPQGMGVWQEDGTAVPRVTFSFDQSTSLTCDEVLYNVAVGEPVPMNGAPCIETYLLETDQASATLDSSDPTAELFRETRVGLVGAPDPYACEKVMVGLAIGKAMPATVAPCVTAYMLPQSDDALAGESGSKRGG